MFLIWKMLFKSMNVCVMHILVSIHEMGLFRKLSSFPQMAKSSKLNLATSTIINKIQVSSIIFQTYFLIQLRVYTTGMTMSYLLSYTIY